MERNRHMLMELIPAIRMLLSGPSSKSGSFVPLDEMLETDPEKVSVRLGRPVVVFGNGQGELLASIEKKRDQIGEYLFLESLGLLGLATNQSKIEQKLGTVRRKSRGAGLPEPVAPPQIRKPLYNRIVAVTGGAMGYGKGIARELFAEGANVAVMDIEEEAGQALVDELNGNRTANRALFIRTDVAEPGEVEDAVYRTVLEFAGLDVMISNAGVLKAGTIDEMDPETFELINRVNYRGYYHCIRSAVPVMRAQNRHAPENYGDIIQINSKSGVEGSRKNFAYSGSKFAGMGLTHSLAMDLMPERIKVNAICPGNYFEGPLWSDPETGLFRQYLEKGKVQGAKTVEDVRRHYESKVPAGRGCRIEDVVKAIKYVIEQEYETGQALMVTGGQVMLG